ncbi:MAG TPA: ABC transporter ATP-binding protein [Gemmatimonadales bacterium]
MSGAVTAPAMDVVLSASGVIRRFGYRTVLAGVSLSLRRGEVLLLVGPNGAGKTTLLRVLAGLLRPATGHVERHGAIGMVAHDAMLYPALSGRANLRFFARLHGIADLGRVDAVLEQVGLSRRADDRVGTFSRGMLQRVAIARALVHEPELLLFDEPLSGLDAAASRTLVELLASFRERGTAMIIVSHEMERLGRVATHIVRLAAGRLGPVESLTGRDPGAVFAELMRGDL